MFPSFHVFGTKVRQFPRTTKVPLINLLFWREWNLPLAKFLSVENNKPLKDLRAGWMMGYQVKTFRLCCSLVLLFRQSFISVAGCWFKPSRWIGKGFGAVCSPTEEETAPNGLPLDLFLFQMRIGYFCIRQWDKQLRLINQYMLDLYNRYRCL